MRVPKFLGLSLVVGGLCLAAAPRSRAMPPPAAPSVTFEYSVQLVEQPNNSSCWAASAAMVVGWRDCVSLTPESMRTDPYLRRAFASTLPVQGVGHLAQATGLIAEDPRNYTIRGWAELLATYGPLWVGISRNNHPSTRHVVVVAGIETDGTPDGTNFLIANPSRQETVYSTQGTFETYWLPCGWFLQEYEAIAQQQLQGQAPPGTLIFQVLHSDPHDMCNQAAQEVRRCRRVLAPILSGH